jgi:single-stranded-DNA-specific exonuclease
LPAALAVINPKRHDCPYPDKYLAEVGVALKVVVLRHQGRDSWLPGF